MSIPFTWVYLIYDPHTMLFKIGRSDNPEARLKQLQTPASYGTIPAAPTDYMLIEAWLMPESREAELHTYYQRCRIRGEWFDLLAFFGEGDWIDVKEHFELLHSEWHALKRGNSLTYDTALMWRRRCEEQDEINEHLRTQLQIAVLKGFAAMPLALKPAPDNLPTNAEVAEVLNELAHALEEARNGETALR